MRIARSIVQAVGVLTLGASVPGLQGQAPSQSLEQQLRSQYQLTRVGSNGTVVGQPGAILVMQEDGLTAIPAAYGPYWYSTFKRGGHIKSSMVQHGGTVATSERRPFQVGEKLYLVNMEVTATEIAFNVQSCGACDLSVNPNDSPYRARLTFQFEKGYLSTADPKQVLEAVGQVFGIAASAPPPPSPPPPPPPHPPVASLKLPSIYVSAQTQTDQLRLNADDSFSLQEAGQPYRGTFTVNGNTVELTITGGPTTTATIQGSNLTDSSGQTWVLQEQPAGTPAGGVVLRNEDVIRMAKAGLDDAIIIAKIGSSRCQFDTSTDALIQLKQTGVSAGVIKAIVAAGR